MSAGKSEIWKSPAESFCRTSPDIVGSPRISVRTTGYLDVSVPTIVKNCTVYSRYKELADNIDTNTAREERISGRYGGSVVFLFSL